MTINDFQCQQDKSLSSYSIFVMRCNSVPVNNSIARYYNEITNKVIPKKRFKSAYSTYRREMKLYFFQKKVN